MCDHVDDRSEPEHDSDQPTAESPLTPDEWRDAVLESDGGFV